ncbi:MAG: hypothetical protein AB8F78_05055 [Saprospiraceae bacterium]
MMAYKLPISELTIKVKAKYKVEVNRKNMMVVKQRPQLLSTSYEVTTSTVADESNTYLLRYRNHAAAEDEVTFTVDHQGLLNKGITVSSDRTAAFVSKLTDVSTILSERTTSESHRGLLESYIAIIDYEGVVTKKLDESAGTYFTAVLHPSFVVNVPPLIKESISVDSKKETFVYKHSADKSKSSNDSTIVVSATRKSSKNETVPVYSSGTLHVGITLPEELFTGNLALKKRLDDLSDDEKARVKKLKEAKRKGIITRLSSVGEVRALADPNVTNIALDLVLNSPVYQISYIRPEREFIIPLRRTTFSERKDSIILSKGLVSTSMTRTGSSLEGVASIPIDIAKAIVSIPAEILQIKLNNTNSRKDLETALLSLTNEQTKTEAYSSTSEERLAQAIQTIQNSGLTLDLSTLTALQGIDNQPANAASTIQSVNLAAEKVSLEIEMQKLQNEMLRIEVEKLRQQIDAEN